MPKSHTLVGWIAHCSGHRHQHTGHLPERSFHRLEYFHHTGWKNVSWGRQIILVLTNRLRITRLHTFSTASTTGQPHLLRRCWLGSLGLCGCHVVYWRFTPPFKMNKRLSVSRPWRCGEQQSRSCILYALRRSGGTGFAVCIVCLSAAVRIRQPLPEPGVSDRFEYNHIVNDSMRCRIR